MLKRSGPQRKRMSPSRVPSFRPKTKTCSSAFWRLRSRSGPRAQRATQPWNMLVEHQGCAAPRMPAEELQESSAELGLRWSAHRLEQAVHARYSKILSPGTAILRKGRCSKILRTGTASLRKGRSRRRNRVRFRGTSSRLLVVRLQQESWSILGRPAMLAAAML